MAATARKVDEIDISLRRSRRAKRATLKVRPGQPPEVVLPLRMPESEADRLLRENRDWLRKKMQWARLLESEAEALGLLTPGLVWISGEPRLAPTLRHGTSSADTRLQGWYREQARLILNAETEQIWRELREAGLIRRPFGRISIRDQKSRWGSCTAQGNLSYSWRLLMMPPEVRHYVVCHELCHLEMLNHSAKFWALVSEARPGWRRETAWLRRFGPLLSLHLPKLSPLPPSVPARLPGPDTVAVGAQGR